MSNAEFIDFLYGRMRRGGNKVIYFKTNRGNYLLYKTKQGSFMMTLRIKRKIYHDIEKFNYPMRLNFGHRVLAALNKYTKRGLRIKVIEEVHV